MREKNVSVAVLRSSTISTLQRNDLILVQKRFAAFLQNCRISIEQIYFRNANLRNYIVTGNAAGFHLHVSLRWSIKGTLRKKLTN